MMNYFGVIMFDKINFAIIEMSEENKVLPAGIPIKNLDGYHLIDCVQWFVDLLSEIVHHFEWNLTILSTQQQSNLTFN